MDVKTKDGATMLMISRADEFTADYIRRELWGDKMSKPRTKDEVLKFLEDNPESAEKLLELVACITCDAMADKEEGNDLPISPGDWYVAGEEKTGGVYIYAPGRTGPIARCFGKDTWDNAKAIAALPELLRATYDHLAVSCVPLAESHPTARRLHHALKAAIGIAPHSAMEDSDAV